MDMEPFGQLPPEMPHFEMLPQEFRIQSLTNQALTDKK
jgi:hypothetical protein